MRPTESRTTGSLVHKTQELSRKLLEGARRMLESEPPQEENLWAGPGVSRHADERGQSTGPPRRGGRGLCVPLGRGQAQDRCLRRGVRNNLQREQK